MKSQSDNNTQHRLLVRELLGSVENALDEFWETHIEDTKFAEDVLPEITRTNINSKILQRAKSALASKRTQELDKLTGASHFASTLRGQVVDGYLDEASEGIETYFDGLSM